MYKKINILLGFSFFIISCSSVIHNQIIYDSSINGQTLELKTKQAFILELDLMASAGYQWDCKINDSLILSLDSINYRPKDENKNLVGGVTIASFYFSAIKKGKTKVELIEHRSWEKEIEPINKISFYVNIN